MSTDGWTDQETVVHIYNGILLSHKNECLWVSSNEVDEPRVYYTEKSEREKQITYINAYVWNLERWYQWTCLQWRCRYRGWTVDTVGEGAGGMSWERSIATSTLLCVKIDRQWEFAVWPKPRVLWQPRGVRWGRGRKGGSMEEACVYLWLIHVDVWQKSTQHCKAIILQLKIH